jgi:hypothetical protein
MPIRKIPDGTPADVLAVAKRFWNGTNDYDRFRLHEWNDACIWCSSPGGMGWAARGLQTYGQVIHRVLPRDLTRVSTLRGALREWPGRAPKSTLRAFMGSLLHGFASAQRPSEPAPRE